MNKKVLIIGLDGLRYDAVAATNTPNLDSLMAEGVYADYAMTENDSVSGVCWTAVLKGVHQAKHKIKGNDFSNQDLSYKTLFKLAKEWNPSIKTVAHAMWKPIIKKIFEPGSMDIESSGKDKVMAYRTVRDINKGRGDLYFVHLDDVDHAGHAHRYTIKSKKYLQQVEVTDKLVGKIVAAVKKRPPEEDWLIVTVSDHGGKFKSHGGQSWGELNVVFIISGNYIVKKGKLPYDQKADKKREKTPHLVDVLPIIAKFLGIPPLPEWDGKLPDGFTSFLVG